MPEKEAGVFTADKTLKTKSEDPNFAKNQIKKAQAVQKKKGKAWVKEVRYSSGGKEKVKYILNQQYLGADGELRYTKSSLISADKAKQLSAKKD